MSSNGSSWTDLTTTISNANVCLKAYVTTAVPRPPSPSPLLPASGTYTSGSSLTVNWTSDQALSTGEFGVWVRSATEDWYIGQLIPAERRHGLHQDHHPGPFRPEAATR